MSRLRGPRRLVIAAILVAASAEARDPERAAQLFRDGRDAMASQDYATACRLFIESESADPRVGTLINLAKCEEALGKLATARQYWQQAVDLARAVGDERVEYAGSELSRIDGRVPRLTVRLTGSAPPDTSIRRDGVDFGSGSYGVPLPVESGAHTITVRAPRHAPHDFVVELGEGERRELVVEPGPLLEEPARPPPVIAPVPARPVLEGPAAQGPGALRPAAYVVGAAGVVGIGVGAVLGLLAMSSGKDASAHCDGDVCDHTGTVSRNDEIQRANAASAFFVSGATLVTAGFALRVLSPSEGEAPYVQRNLGLVAGGAGLAAGIVGGLFGIKAIVAGRDASSGCVGDVCNHAGAAARRQEISAGNASTAAFAIGGALLAGGVVLWLTAPRARTATMGAIRVVPAAGPTGGWVRLAGEW